MKKLTQIITAIILLAFCSCKEEDKTIPISLSIAITNVTGNGLSNGAIDLTVEGGKEPYVFEWSNGANSEDLADIPAGEYSVIVTDADGQTANDTGIVTEPELLDINFVKTNTSSTNGTDGSVDITVTGGVEPYTYTWSNGSTDEDLVGIMTDSFYVTITDANTITIIDTVVIADPLSVSGTVINASYYDGNDGRIDPIVIGGIKPYTYLWSNNRNYSYLTNIKAGDYSVTVTDAEGETANASFTITQPDKLFETIGFNAADSLEITANLYHKADDLPVILLCHQAGYSRGEYSKTATILYEKGYNCMAIDQRSGNSVNGVENQTAKRATEQGLSTDYIDALPDIQAAVDYLYNKYNKQIIIVGSSYSCALSFKIAFEDDHVSAIAVFSIYYDFLVNNLNLDLSEFTKPIFMTAEKSLINSQVQKIYNAISSENKTIFIPSTEGKHGSSALNCSIGDEYWAAFEEFLNNL